MLAAGKPATYVDPFDRICHGLRARKKANSATTDSKEAHLV